MKWDKNTTKEEIRNFIYKEYLSHENISKVAYNLWKEQGCPDGDQYLPEYSVYKTISEMNWFNAKGKLKCVAETDTWIYKTLLMLKD